MTNTGGDRRADFAVVPDFEAAFCAGWTGSRTLMPTWQLQVRAGSTVIVLVEK